MQWSAQDLRCAAVAPSSHLHILNLGLNADWRAVQVLRQALTGKDHETEIFATHAPDQLHFFHSELYCEGPKLVQKLGHV